MTKIASIVCAAVITVLTPNFAYAQDDTAEFKEAAERLRALLNEAADADFVDLRGKEEESEPSSESENSSASANATTPQEKKNKKAKVERSLRGGEKAVVMTPQQCDLSKLLNFAEFKDAPSYDEIFKLRNILVDPRGQYDYEAAKKLAKTYVALGMAEEAIALTDVVNKKEVAFLGELAKIVKGGSLQSADKMKKYLPCTDLAGLWIAAALIDDAPDEALQYANDYVTEIGQFSPDLKFFFASRLGILAAEREDYTLAKIMVQKLSRLERPNDPAVQYLEALVGAASDESANLDLLREEAQTQGPYQAKALIRLGELSKNTPYQNYSRDLELVSAQYAGFTDADIAKQMNIRFLAEEGALQKAIDTSLEDFSDKSATLADTKDILANTFLVKLANDDSEVRFSAMVKYLDNIPYFKDLPQEPELRVRSAEVALDNELTGLIDTLVKHYEFTERREQVDLLLAKAALVDGEAGDAYAITSNYMDNASFSELYVQSAIQMGDVLSALRVLDEKPRTVETIERSAQLAWRFGLWASAKDYYAELLLTEQSEVNNRKYSLAAYMSGETGGFFELELASGLLDLETLFDSYEEEEERLKEYLRNG